MQPIDGSVERLRGRVKDQDVGPAHDLGNGDGDVVQDDLYDSLRDVHGHEGNPVGAHNAQPLILVCCYLVGGDVQVPGFDGGEQGDVYIKLRPVCPPEQRVQGKVQWGQLHQHWEPFGQYIPLHRPDFSRPLLLLTSYNSEEESKEVNKAVLVDHEEGELVDPLGGTPHESVKDAMGRSPSIGTGANRNIDGGTQRANCSLGRLIVARTQRPVL